MFPATTLWTRVHRTLRLPLARPRTLDGVARDRVEALLYAERDDAALRAYREATGASAREAARAIAAMRTRLAS